MDKGKTPNGMMSTLMLIVISCIICFGFTLFCDRAYANNVQTAEKITLNSAKAYTFTEGEDEHYYKFIPSETRYYEVNITNFIPDHTYVTVTDSYGDWVAFDGWDQYSNKVRVACKLKKGKTYYICTECFLFDESEKTVNTKITKHSHTYKTAYKYTGGVQEECTVPECYYERMRLTAKPTIKKLKKGKKSFKVTWKCKINCNEGYQIQYSTSSKFKKAKTKKANWDATSKTVKKLKKRKYYYVRIRAFVKTTQLDGSVTTDYGPWSKVKKVKTK